MTDKRVKEAFSKIKQEMEELKEEIFSIKQEFASLSNSLKAFLDQNSPNKLIRSAEECAEVPKNVPNFVPRFKNVSFGTSEDLKEQEIQNIKEISLKDTFSIGNKGVSALRQQIGNTSAHLDVQNKEAKEALAETGVSSKALQENIEKLKHTLRGIFKTLTKQEFFVFALLYQLEDELGRSVSYFELAERANLSPNSLRDYMSKLISKKVPIIKEKTNNRQILLKIAPELRNIETLENLMKIVEG